MINQDFSEFPEHRVGFFKLLRAINLNCFPGKLPLLVFRSLFLNCLAGLCSTLDYPATAVQTVHGQYNLGY